MAVDLQGSEPYIAPLAEDEERLLQTVHRADGNRNDIYLIHRRPTDDETMGTGEPINFVAIIRSTDADPNDTSPAWAWQRGPTERSIYVAVAEAFANVGVLPGHSVSNNPDIQWFADRIREQSEGPNPNLVTQNWAQLYAGACGEVMAAADVCLEVANRAVAGDDQAEREFGPLFTTFDEACTNARETATSLLASQSGTPIFVEMRVSMMFEQGVLDQLFAVKAMLGADFGPTPAAFLQGVAHSTAIGQRNSAHPEDGNIYRPSAAAADVEAQSVHALVAEGRQALADDKVDDAMTAFRDADVLGDGEGAYLLAELLLQVDEFRDEAMQALQRSDERGYAPAATRIGACLADAGDLQAGIEAFQRGHDRGDAQATYFLGTTNDRNGDPAGAAAYYSRALGRGFGRAGLSMGLMLRDLGDAAGSRTAFERGDSLGDPHCAHHVSMLYHADGDMPAAEAAAWRAYEGGVPEAAEWLAVVLNGLGKDDAALPIAEVADQNGSAIGARVLAMQLARRGDAERARGAMARAQARGWDGD